MGLAFLVPAFLAGLLAIGLPIWVHLRNRPKTDTVEFPSLMFIERIPYRAVQRQQLRHRLLFAMRALALLLLIIGFARPFFGDQLPTAAAGGAREVVIALDRSWSMRYDGHWDAAVSAVNDELNQLDAADRVSLILFDAQAEVILESQPAASVPPGLVAGLMPSDLTTSFAAGLRAAGRVLEDNTTLPATEIVLISDFQRSGQGGDIEVRLPEGTRLRPIAVSQTVSNIGVADVSVTRVVDGEQPAARVTARLTRQGGAAPVSVPVTLTVNGEEVQRRSVSMPAAGATRLDFDPVSAAEGLRLEVRIAPDTLAGDDGFYAVASPGEALAVMLLENPGAGASDSLYLERALAVGSRPAFVVDRQVLRDLRLADLAGTDLVILNDAGELDTGSATALADFVTAGGGLIVGLAEMAGGAVSPVLPFAAADVVDRSAELGATLGFVDTAHPVFEAYRSPESGDLSGARFYRYRGLVPAPVEGVLARFDDGAPALVHVGMGTGHVVVWTSSLDTFWSDLPRQPIFVPFIHEVSKFAASYREADAWVPATADRGPGFYREEAEGEPSDVAVNLDRAESDLTPLDPEELLASVAWSSGVEVDGAGNAYVDPARVEAGQSLWWYLIVAALILLLAESTLSNRLSSRASWSSGESELPPGTAP
jgi:Mg-chelatase subunit ChlD